MKKSLLLGAAFAAIALASSAHAADLPRAMTKAPAYQATPAYAAYSWNGSYIGVSGGYSFTDQLNASVGGASIAGTPDPKGGFFGGQIGYNYQFAPTWLLGIEGDAFLSDINGGSSLGTLGGINVSANSKLDKFGTVRGRLGYVHDRSLFYFAGGLAVGQNEATLNISVPGGSTRLFDSQTHVGWTVGGGYEYAFTNAASFRVDYKYMDFGSESYSFAPGVLQPIDLDLRSHAVSGGFNFKFN